MLFYCLSATYAREPELKLSYPCMSLSMPFTKVRVIDCRDYHYIGYVQKGVGNIATDVRFEGKLKDTIKRFFLAADTSGMPKQELVVFLYDFFLTERTVGSGEIGEFKICTRFFYNSGNGLFTELKPVDTTYSFRAPNVTKILLRSVSGHLCEIADLASTLQKIDSNTAYTKTQLNDLDSLEKLKIPVYNTDKINKGIYYNFDQFKANTPEKAEISIDSIGPFQYKAYKQHGDKEKKFKADKSIYAISDGNITLFNFQNGLYRLLKEDDDFFFQAQIYHFDENVEAAGILFGVVGALIATAASDHTQQYSLYTYELSYLNGRPLIFSRGQMP